MATLLKSTSNGTSSMELTDAILSYSADPFPSTSGKYSHSVTTSVPYTYTTILDEKYSDINITLLWYTDIYANPLMNRINCSYVYNKNTRELTITVNSFPDFTNGSLGAGSTSLYMEYSWEKDRLLKNGSKLIKA